MFGVGGELCISKSRNMPADSWLIVEYASSLCRKFLCQNSDTSEISAHVINIFLNK